MHTALPERNLPSRARNVVIADRLQGEILAGRALSRIGSLEVRLARSDAEIVAAQEVRYRVFYEELGARKSPRDKPDGRDEDRFDPLCDHLLVVDHSLPGPDHRRIVGTYRLLRQEAADLAGGFYSQDEFELKRLTSRKSDLKFLELGRSCVLLEYRSKRTIELLWQGIFTYMTYFDVGVLTGCASFHGTVPAAHAEPLSYLEHNCRAAPEWDVRAVADRYCNMDWMPAEAVNAKSALAAMPPLIKGYLRAGAKIGDGCVIDHDFGTVDVIILLPVTQITSRYANYLGSEAERFAA